MSTYLYTKDGKPLRVDGDDRFDRQGRHVGRRQGDKAIEVSDETGPTLAQDDIDSLFNSSRV